MTSNTPITGATMAEDQGLSAALKGCPFCGARLVKNETFSRRNAECFVHPVPEVIEPPLCPAGDVRLYSNNQDSLIAWNTRSEGLSALVGEGVQEEVAAKLYSFSPATRKALLDGGGEEAMEIAWSDLCASLKHEDRALSDLHRRRADSILALIAASLIQGGWRPIETAPKDGSEIVFFDQYGNGSAAVHWDAERGRYENRAGQSTTRNDATAWTHWIHAPPASAEADR